MAVTKIFGSRQIAAASITNAEQNFGTPSTGTDVAIKSYVDSVAQGLSVKPSAAAATVAALSPTNTYSGGVLTATGNGTLTVDGYLTALNDYILVMNEASGLKNGLYKVTTAGTAGVPYVLTRAVEMDVSSEFTGAFVFVEQGTVNVASGWVSTVIAPTVGTTPITFTQFSGAGEITAGNGLSKSANTLSIDTAITADLSTAQTFTNKTLTSPKINENVALTTTATKLNYLTSATGTTGTASTNIVFSTSPVLTTPSLGVASATSLATSAASPLLLTNGQLITIALTLQTTGGATLTIPDFANVSDEFVFKTKSVTMSNKTFVAPVLGAATGTSLVLSSFLNEAKGADIASSGTTNIGAATGNYVNITGVTTITAFDTVQAGTRRELNFNGILTLTYNATSLILPTAANITTAAGDTATFISLGSGNWICTKYQRANGAALTGSPSSTYQRSTVVSGTQDSANKVFTIANTVSSGSEQVYLNGQLMMPGASNDYVYNGTTTITFQAGFTAPAATDVIRVYGTY